LVTQYHFIHTAGALWFILLSVCVTGYLHGACQTVLLRNTVQYMKLSTEIFGNSSLLHHCFALLLQILPLTGLALANLIQLNWPTAV